MASKSISEESLPFAKDKKVFSNNLFTQNRKKNTYCTGAYTRPQGRSREKYTVSHKRAEMVNVQ
jgi:hypothetical protein